MGTIRKAPNAAQPPALEPTEDRSEEEKPPPPHREPELLSEEALEAAARRYQRGGANPLHRAASSGYSRRVQQLLDVGYRADAQALALAAGGGHADAVRVLLKTDAPTFGPLVVAVEEGQAEIVQLILDAG